MKILVLAAMEKEIRLLHNIIGDIEEHNVSGIPVVKGKIGNHEVIIAKTGIGKVNAALTAHQLIAGYHPDLVINSGVAGGLDLKMEVGTVLIADKVAYHDVWCGPGTEYGAADGYPVCFQPSLKVYDFLRNADCPDDNVVFGLLCSGDKFITTSEQVKEIKENFPNAVGCDMESGAIAQVCTASCVPFAVVRVLSDTPGSDSHLAQYAGFWDECTSKTFTMVRVAIENLN